MERNCGKEDGERGMRLDRRVKYRKYGEYTYLRNTALHREYLMNDTAFDLLRILSEYPGCTEERLFEELEKQYEAEDEETFRREILEFLRELEAEKILLGEPEEENSVQEDAAERAQEYCLRHHIVYSACLELTYRCNERCIHCCVDGGEPKGELSFPEYRALLDELARMGCIYLLLTGGEPTLYPEFIRVAEYASGKGFLVDIYTNGYCLSDELLRRMIALDPNSISFSFYGGDGESHDAVTGIPGSFEKSLRAMMICKCAGIDTYIKSIALRQNLDSLEKLYQLGELLRIPVEMAKSLLPTGKGRLGEEELSLQNKEDYIRLLSLEETYRKTLPQRRGRGENLTLCTAGQSVLSVDPYGNVFPCNSLPISLGNIREESLGAIWEKAPQILRERLPAGYLKTECRECISREYCQACPGTMITPEGDFERKDHVCLLAEAAYQYREGKEGIG
ncbi:MAG TPA: radical SAM protein [Candidatus Choladousia intestinavium]|uniref:Radical SAM protein n=1 Tax=Candidatus Choladousia intestinavium TaxID=2840727 RepID=A0A9D1ACY8_9FIRM|nr:radical SAM protein [Candidatus Choladousia intestinavium]